MATSAMAYLRRAFPTDRIVVLSRKSTAGIWEGHPTVDHVVVADDRRMDPLVFQQLRSERFDAAILFPNSFRSAWTAWQLGIPRRFGYSRAWRAWLLTDPLLFLRRDWQTPTPKPLTRKSIRPPRGPAREPRHMVEYYLDLATFAAARLGSELPPPVVNRKCGVPELVLPVREDARRVVNTLLAELGIPSDEPLIGIHPGAAYGEAKRWPLERLAEAASILASELGASVVITAGPSERDLCDKLKQLMRARVYDVGPRLDLPALAALLERLTLFIGNDTGVTHMAAAVGVPTIAVFGPMDWNVTHPWSARAVVVRRSPPCAPCFLRECPIDHRCMLDVHPQDVVEAANQLLSRVKGSCHGVS